MTEVVNPPKEQAIEVGSRRSLPEWLYRVAVALAAIALAGLAWIRTPRYFYIDDTQSQGLPTMHLIGRTLREGQWKLLYSDLGVGGNLATDPQYGMFFPPKLLLSIYVSLFDDVRLAASLLSALFLAVLALGMVFALRAGGASRGWSAAAALATASSGFLFVWAAAGWQPALWAFALIPWLWYSLIKERAAILVPGVFLTSWGLVGFAFPFAAVCGIALFCCWAVVQLWNGRRFRLVVSAALAMASGCLLGAINYLPLFLAASYTTRNSGLRNDAGLVPNLGDLLSSWSPVSTAQMYYWNGHITAVPILYLGWFILPILPLIRWRRDILGSPRILEMTLFGSAALLLSQLPSEVGPFRWPFRVIPAIAIAAAALIALIVSRVGLRVTRGRLLWSAGLLLVGVWMQFGRTPTDVLQIVASFMVVAALFTWLAMAVKRGRSASLVATVGTMVCAVCTLWALPAPGTNPEVLDFGYATKVSEMPALPVAPDQRTMLLHTPSEDIAADYAKGITVAFVPVYQNRYPGLGYFAVGQKTLQAALCQDFLGRVCPAAVPFLASREQTTGQRWMDLLNYSQILVSDELYDPAQFEDWRVAERLDGYVILERPTAAPAETVSYAAPGVDISVESQAANSTSYSVRSESGGRIVFDEIYWPGWRAELDGRDIPVTDLDGILLTLDLPAGADGTLTITYGPVPPSLTLGLLVTSLVCLLGAALIGRRNTTRTKPDAVNAPV